VISRCLCCALQILCINSMQYVLEIGDQNWAQDHTWLPNSPMKRLINNKLKDRKLHTLYCRLFATKSTSTSSSTYPFKQMIHLLVLAHPRCFLPPSERASGWWRKDLLQWQTMATEFHSDIEMMKTASCQRCQQTEQPLQPRHDNSKPSVGIHSAAQMLSTMYGH